MFILDCILPLGMEDGRIPDNNITASSHYTPTIFPEVCLPSKGRLNQCCSNAWCAEKAESGQYLQVDLGSVRKIVKVNCGMSEHLS